MIETNIARDICFGEWMMKMMKSILLIIYFVALLFMSPLMRASDWSLRTRADEPQDSAESVLSITIIGMGQR